MYNNMTKRYLRIVFRLNIEKKTPKKEFHHKFSSIRFFWNFELRILLYILF